MEKKKSTFVTVFGWMMVVLPALFLLWLFFVLFFFEPITLNQELESPVENNNKLTTAFINLIYLLLLLPVMISGYFLTKRKNWARLITLGFLALFMTIQFHTIFFTSLTFTTDLSHLIPDYGSFKAILYILIVMGIGIIIGSGICVYMLTREKVKVEFLGEGPIWERVKRG